MTGLSSPGRGFHEHHRASSRRRRAAEPRHVARGPEGHPRLLHRHDARMIRLLLPGVPGRHHRRKVLHPVRPRRLRHLRRRLSHRPRCPQAHRTWPCFPGGRPGREASARRAARGARAWHPVAAWPKPSRPKRPRAPSSLAPGGAGQGCSGSPSPRKRSTGLQDGPQNGLRTKGPLPVPRPAWSASCHNFEPRRTFPCADLPATGV